MNFKTFAVITFFSFSTQLSFAAEVDSYSCSSVLSEPSDPSPKAHITLKKEMDNLYSLYYSRNTNEIAPEKIASDLQCKFRAFNHCENFKMRECNSLKELKLLEANEINRQIVLFNCHSSNNVFLEIHYEPTLRINTIDRLSMFASRAKIYGFNIVGVPNPFVLNFDGFKRSCLSNIELSE